MDRVLTFESALPLHNIGTGNNNLKQENNVRNGSEKGPQKSPPKTSQEVKFKEGSLRLFPSLPDFIVDLGLLLSIKTLYTI